NAAGPAGGAVADPATNYDKCVSDGILDLSAHPAGSTTPYPNGKSDTIQRGLFADMLAQALQKEVDAGVIKNVYATNATFPANSASSGTQMVKFTSPNDGSPTTGGAHDVVFSGLNSQTVDVALTDCGTFADGGHPGAITQNGKFAFRDQDTKDRK